MTGSAAVRERSAYKEAREELGFLWCWAVGISDRDKGAGTGETDWEQGCGKRGIWEGSGTVVSR